MTKKEELVEKLKLIGFSEYAAKAYLHIVGLGSSTPMELSKTAEIPRGKIYEVLEDLHKEGFVGRDEKSKPMKYFAYKPNKIFDKWLKQFKDLASYLEEAYDTSNANYERGFYSIGNYSEKLNLDDFVYIFAHDDDLFIRFFEGKKVLIDGKVKAHNYYRVGGPTNALMAISKNRMIVLFELEDRVQFLSFEDSLFSWIMDQIFALSSVNRSITTEMAEITLEGENILYIDSIMYAEGSVFGQNGTLWLTDKRLFIHIPGKAPYARPIFTIDTCFINTEDGRLELIIKSADGIEETCRIYPESDPSLIINLISFIQKI